MTFEEAKDKLQELKHAKRRVKTIHDELQLLIGIKSSLNVSEGHPKGKFHSSVEQAYAKIEVQQVKLADALNSAFALEDELAAAIGTLSPIEQDIIIGSYMRQRTHEQLAEEIGYTTRNIEYIKRSAIKKLSRKS